jgi:8-oxo-dGTP diphosphatase
MKPSVIAAGGVVWRRNPAGEVEVALVHRPRYDDWSLPKGKLENGEPLIACAYREIMEETGLNIQIGPLIGDIEYFVPDGLKQVTYWCAKLLGLAPSFTPNEEVDALEWLILEEADVRLTRESDREILERFADTPFDSYPLILLRHAKALDRAEWQNDDEDRPLDYLGQQQSKRMHAIYQVFALQEIHTSDAVRCFDTVAPLARVLDITPKVKGSISEYGYKKNKEKAIDYVKDLIKENRSTLLCSHNPVLPKMLEKLAKKVDFHYSDEKLQPGEAWVVHHDGKRVLQIDRLDAPTIQ